MMKRRNEGDIVPKLLRVVADLVRGKRHSRSTVSAETGRSLATADRWLKQIVSILPNMMRERDNDDRRTTWITHQGTSARPPRLAVIGACIAASLASMFEGTQHERNLKDARDHLLRQRGESYGDIDRKFVFAPRGGEYALPESAAGLDEVIDALLGTNIVDFSYEHNSGHRERISVEPLSLVLFDHQFYVLARKEDRSFYCYRFARMSQIDSTRRSFVYPSKNEYDPKNVLEPCFGVHISGTGPVEDIAVVLHGAWAKLAEKHRWHPSQRVEPRGDGSVLITLRVRHCPELETWILGFGEQCTVLRPHRLRESIAERLAKASATYAHGASGRGGPSNWEP